MYDFPVLPAVTFFVLCSMHEQDVYNPRLPVYIAVGKKNQTE